MVSLRRHFVPNPVSPSRTNPTPNCQPSLFGHTWYDGLNRRTARKVEAGETEAYQYFYYNASWQRLEMRPDVTTGDPPEQLQPYCQHVWSARYIDSPVLWDRDADNDSETGDLGKSGSGLEERLYYLGDANFNVTTLVDTSGEAVEHYQYDPYGRVKVLNGAGPDTDGDEWTDDPYNNTDVANVILYTGREYDSFICLYQYRHRYYHAELGRFLNRDPIGYDAGDENLYRYVGNHPVSAIDPYGLDQYLGADSYSGSGWPLNPVFDPPCLMQSPYSFAPFVPAPNIAYATPVPRVDHTGRIHDDLPDRVPADWSPDTIRDALGEVEDSLRSRHENQELHGRGDERPCPGHPTHRGRIKEELDWRGKLQDALRRCVPEPPTPNQVVGATAMGLGAWLMYAGGTGTLVLLADDATGVGVADDPLIIVTGGMYVAGGIIVFFWE